jgi:hypothetical protein
VPLAFSKGSMVLRRAGRAMAHKGDMRTNGRPLDAGRVPKARMQSPRAMGVRHARTKTAAALASVSPVFARWRRVWRGMCPHGTERTVFRVRKAGAHGMARTVCLPYTVSRLW